MSHYSENDASVKLSLFKPSGKWMSDRALDMSGFYNENSIQEAVMLAMYNAGIKSIYGAGGFAVVLEPHHKHSHPVVVWEEKYAEELPRLKAEIIRRRSQEMEDRRND